MSGVYVCVCVVCACVSVEGGSCECVYVCTWMYTCTLYAGVHARVQSHVHCISVCVCVGHFRIHNSISVT